jgi:serine/threonine protein kinase
MVDYSWAKSSSQVQDSIKQPDDGMPATLDSYYKYQEKIGEGACGSVYKYKHSQTGEEVAIKVE